jgi:hypothetical protein
MKSLFRGFSLRLLFIQLPLIALFIGVLPGASPPRFEDYSTEPWTGKPAPVIIRSRLERMFQTRLREAGKQLPNFAGHYNFVLWGCGANCVSGAIVDLQTGEALLSPFASKTGGPHWNVCQSAFSSPVADFRIDSRLLVIRCGKTWIDRIKENLPDEYYFELNDGKFKLLSHLVPK